MSYLVFSCRPLHLFSLLIANLPKPVLGLILLPLLILRDAQATEQTNEQTSTKQPAIEVIHVLGQRNNALANPTVDHNREYYDISETSTIKTNIAQWLADIPGISLNGQGGLFQSYSIRGFSKWRIQTLVDGIPIYTDRRAGNSASFIPELLLSGIDATKGPSSALYGSDAIGGIINLTTLGYDHNAFSASWKNQGNQQELLTALGDSHWQSAMTIRRSHNASDASGTPLDTSFKQYSLLQKNKTQWRDIDLSMTWLASYGEDIGKSSAQYPSQRITLYPQDMHHLWQLEASQDDNWYARLFHHYQNWDSEVTRVNAHKTLTAYQAHTLGASLLTAMSLWSGHARFGFDWTSRQGVSINESEFSLANQLNYRQPLLDGQQHNIGLFSDIVWQFDQLVLSAGFRHDYISLRQSINSQQRSDQQSNANIALNWQLSTQLNMQLEFATGFRFPTLTELYFNGETPRGTTLGNSTLAPETSQGMQFSLTSQINETWLLAVNNYYYQLDNYIERYRLTDGSRSYRNLEQVTLYGSELALTWQQSKQLEHKFSYQWQKGKNQQSQPIADLVPSQFAWHIEWLWQQWQISHQFALRLRQTDVGSGEQTRPSWLNWQLSASYPLSPDMRIVLSGDNLFNRQAATTADEDAPQVIGRTLGLKLSYIF